MNSGEVLTSDEIRFVKDLFKKVKEFKIELEDLYQEARLAKLSGESVSAHLEKYCATWSHDPCSFAENKEFNFTVPKNISEWTLAPEDWQTINETLSSKERWVVGLFLDGLTQRDIGDRLGISHQTVGKILKKAISKIKKLFKDKDFK